MRPSYSTLRESALSMTSLKRPTMFVQANEGVASRTYRELPPDMWGVTILVVIADMPHFHKCDFEHHVRGFFCNVCIGVNLWLQFVILYYVNRYIVGKSIHDTQAHYEQFHREVFNPDGSFAHEKWKVWEGPFMELCNLTLTNVPFAMAIIFTWTTRMVGELRSIKRLCKDIHNIAGMPSDGSATDMLLEMTQSEDIGNGEDTENIKSEITEWRLIALTPVARVLIYSLVIIPKLAIACILLHIGCRWLTATESFSDLILNALALDFIINVDELVFDNFAPLKMQEWLKSTTILHMSVGRESVEHAVTRPYIKSLVYVVLCLLWSYFYLTELQQVIPGFHFDISEHCDGWIEAYYKPKCGEGFLSKHPERCFPYGGE